MASQALMWDKKALPNPWPSEAPLTRPAMSTTFRNAGTLLQHNHNKKVETREETFCQILASLGELENSA